MILLLLHANTFYTMEVLCSAKYLEKFISYVKENYHTNVYTMLNKEYLNEDDRRTIYMHDFFHVWKFSEQYNRLTLAYLLFRKQFWNLDTSGHFWMEMHITVILKLTICTHRDVLGGNIFGCKFSWIKK